MFVHERRVSKWLIQHHPDDLHGRDGAGLTIFNDWSFSCTKNVYYVVLHELSTTARGTYRKVF